MKSKEYDLIKEMLQMQDKLDKAIMVSMDWMRLMKKS